VAHEASLATLVPTLCEWEVVPDTTGPDTTITRSPGEPICLDDQTAA
jgi:hypothetical protein